MRHNYMPDRSADIATGEVHERMAVAMNKWHRGWVERAINALSWLAALATFFLFLSSGATAAGETDFIESCVPSVIPADASRVVLVSAGGPEATKPAVLSEMIESYLDIRVDSVSFADFDPASLEGARSLIVYGDDAILDETQAAQTISAAWSAELTVTWIGPGVYTAAGPLEVELNSSDPAFGSAPQGAKLFYKGIPVPVDDLLMAESVSRSLTDHPMEVLAWYRDPNGVTRPAISSRADFLHIGFDALSGFDENDAMVITMDALANTLKDRQPDPRVIFRFEDLNPYNYGEADNTVAEVAEYLLSRGVFLHMAVIPEFVNADGQVIGDIGDAPAVREVLKAYPDRTELIQHGYHHHRDDPRNEGLMSGAAFEFFFDDDETLGKAEVVQMTLERLNAGRVLVEDNLQQPVWAFEAPHWEMSSEGETAVEYLYDMIHHPPLNQGGIQNNVVTPWFTIRGDTSYAPSAAGFIGLNQYDSVEQTLDRLQKLSSLIPDPVVIVYFHPFMWNVPGRRDDLRVLVDGIEALGFRFVSSCAQVSRIR